MVYLHKALERFSAFHPVEEMGKFILLRQIMWCLLWDGTNEVAHFYWIFFNENLRILLIVAQNWVWEWNGQRRAMREGGRENLTKLGFIVSLRKKSPVLKPENTRQQVRKGAKVRKKWLNTQECVAPELLMGIWVRSRSGAGWDLGINHIYSWASNLYFFSKEGVLEGYTPRINYFSNFKP